MAISIYHIIVAGGKRQVPIMEEYEADSLAQAVVQAIEAAIAAGLRPITRIEIKERQRRRGEA